MLHKRYVAQNLQNCVRILTIFSESKLEQKMGVLRDKTSLHFQDVSMIGMIFAFLDGSCPKFKIVLQKRYVAQHLQNWVLILTIFSESNPKQNCGCYVKKLVFIFKNSQMA